MDGVKGKLRTVVQLLVSDYTNAEPLYEDIAPQFLELKTQVGQGIGDVLASLDKQAAQTLERIASICAGRTLEDVNSSQNDTGNGSTRRTQT
jgi:hypothetical protein